MFITMFPKFSLNSPRELSTNLIPVTELVNQNVQEMGLCIYIFKKNSVDSYDHLSLGDTAMEA